VTFPYVLINNSTIQGFDYLLYNYFLNLQGYRNSNELVIVAIDDMSLQEIGRWPWSRRIHAVLLDRLTELDAGAVGFYIRFSEPGLNDTESANLIAQNLLSVLQQPISFRDASVFFTPCMGLSLWPTESEDGEGLLRDANIAVFSARLSHSDSVCVYLSQIAKEVQERSQLEQALIFAIELDEFEVYYHVNTSSNITGVGHGSGRAECQG
jgi:predicted signal transduction protein with EAL and GGDEF domain